MIESKSSSVPSMRIKDWVVLITVALITFLVYAASLDAKLDIRQDDHRILFFSDHEQPQHEQLRNTKDAAGKTIEPTLSWFLESDIAVGRFRPLTQALEVAMPRALGDDPFRLHLLVMLLTILTSMVLFTVGFKLGGSSLEGAAMAMFVLLAPDPGPSKVWYLMSVKAELWGTLFTLFAVLATIKASHSTSRVRDDILPVVMIAVAMLFKEPFALLVPAMLILRLSLPFHYGNISNWRQVPRWKFVIFGYMALLVAYSIAIWMGLSASPKDSYGTRSLHDWSLLGSGLINIFRQMPIQAVWFAPLILAFWVLIRRFGVAKTAIAFSLPAFTAVAWVAPQVLLYAARGGMWDHYWLPALLGIAALNIWCLRIIRLNGSPGIMVFALLMSLIWVVNGVRTNYFAVQNYVQLTHMRQDAAGALINRVPEGGVVIIVADNKVYSEYAMSWLFFAANKGKSHTKYLLYDVTEPNGRNFSKSIFFPHTPSLDSINSCQVDAVVFLSQPKEIDGKWHDWYSSECLANETFLADQRYFSLRKLDKVNQPVHLNIAFHKPVR